MHRLAYAAFAAAYLASQAVAAEQPQAQAPHAAALKLPAQIQAQPGKVFEVRADTNLKWMRWTIPAGLERVPPEFTKVGENGFVGYGPAGVYEFKVEGTLNDVFQEAKCVVFVGQPTPIPPGPTPPGPFPGDPLQAELQTLFKSHNLEHRDKVVQIWLGGAADVYGNKNRKTLRDFYTAMHTVAVSFPFELGNDDLGEIRKKLGDELKALCSANDLCPLGDPKSELRAKAKALLERYAAALGACK